MTRQLLLNSCMDTESKNAKARRIEKQVESWDTFAKLAPTFFLFVCFILLVTGNTTFDNIFLFGMMGFSITAVIWWFWTIYSIRFLVRMFNQATNDLIETGEELKSVRKELRDATDNSNQSD